MQRVHSLGAATLVALMAAHRLAEGRAPCPARARPDDAWRGDAWGDAAWRGDPCRAPAPGIALDTMLVEAAPATPRGGDGT